MRLGGPVTGYNSPGSWIAALKERGYRAAYAPLDGTADAETVRAYALAALEAGIVIAEVGAWCNPLSPDDLKRHAAIEYCTQQLDLADRIGALCCVNIAGSRGAQWDGPHPENFTDETFDMIVETVRRIIDAVHPVRAHYALETMPWMYPDSPESYLRLIKAIDRRRFAAHLDPANLIYSPHRYYQSSALIEECIELLGPHLKSVHLKDVLLESRMTVHLDEVRPGLGGLDFPRMLKALSRVSTDLPLMLEHLPSDEEYRSAAQFVWRSASAAGVHLE